MASLVYSCIASLDGFTADADGSFDWAAPDEEVHAFVNDAERPVGTYLYGRGMYETMRFWQSPPAGLSAVSRDYAGIWRAADKVVFSRTLTEVTTPRTRLERTFDPEAVRAVVQAARPAGEHRRARPSPPTPCGPGSSTSCTCWRSRTSSAAAPRGCRPGCGSSSSCWPSGGSPTGRSTRATGCWVEPACAAPRPPALGWSPAEPAPAAAWSATPCSGNAAPLGRR